MDGAPSTLTLFFTLALTLFTASSMPLSGGNHAISQELVFILVFIGEIDGHGAALGTGDAGMRGRGRHIGHSVNQRYRAEGGGRGEREIECGRSLGILERADGLNQRGDAGAEQSGHVFVVTQLFNGFAIGFFGGGQGVTEDARQWLARGGKCLVPAGLNGLGGCWYGMLHGGENMGAFAAVDVLALSAGGTVGSFGNTSGSDSFLRCLFWLGGFALGPACKSSVGSELAAFGSGKRAHTCRAAR